MLLMNGLKKQKGGKNLRVIKYPEPEQEIITTCSKCGAELAYVKNTIPYLDSLSITEDKIKKVFKTLVNAYNNKVPLYIENKFTKEKYGCKFAIILKGE